MVGMMRRIQASERHPSDEASPQVRSEEVGDRGIHKEQSEHEEKEGLVLRRDLRLCVLLLWYPCQNVLGQELWPEIYCQPHGKKHEGHSNDRSVHGLEHVELTPQAEQHVEEHQREDVVHEGCGNDGLAKVLLEDAGLAEETERDAHTCRSQRRPCRDTIWHEGSSKENGQSATNDQWKDRAEDSDAAGRQADDLGFLEIEMHSAFEDHQANTCVADQREEVGEASTALGHFMLALFHQALRVAVIVATGQPPVTRAMSTCVAVAGMAVAGVAVAGVAVRVAC
mmetsp:Transcript_71867/g.171746  ORF Transcript_71867/g.171746 Transcript_71867/m.171746 type:complete len:283 (+) Transcript_71867:726-1574(+)